MKRLTLRLLVAALTFVIGVAFSVFWVAPRVSHIPPASVSVPTDGLLVFEGTVLQIAPPVAPSGVFANYRLAKYRVERVCRGHYEQPEVIVDHLSLTARELDGIKIGDRVCVSVELSKEIFVRTNVEGIREESERVETFYIGGRVAAPGSPCECGDK
jgi:hypothetical protein